MERGGDELRGVVGRMTGGWMMMCWLGFRMNEAEAWSDPVDRPHHQVGGHLG